MAWVKWRTLSVFLSKHVSVTYGTQARTVTSCSVPVSFSLSLLKLLILNDLQTTKVMLCKYTFSVIYLVSNRPKWALFLKHSHVHILVFLLCHC
jgi:hypothetical protein